MAVLPHSTVTAAPGIPERTVVVEGEGRCEQPEKRTVK